MTAQVKLLKLPLYPNATTQTAISTVLASLCTTGSREYTGFMVNIFAETSTNAQNQFTILLALKTPTIAQVTPHKLSKTGSVPMRNQVGDVRAKMVIDFYQLQHQCHDLAKRAWDRILARTLTNAQKQEIPVLDHIIRVLIISQIRTLTEILTNFPVLVQIMAGKFK
jgi:hypothetical protein